YYTGGGDWFPASWNRYGMPFNLILVNSMIILFYGAFFFILKGWMRNVGLVVISFSLICSYARSIAFFQNNCINALLSSVSNLPNQKWGRINNLASLGFFLRSVLPSDAVVASPEEATI